MNLDITATAPASPTTPAPGPVEGASTGAARVTSDDAASQAAVTVDTILKTVNANANKARALVKAAAPATIQAPEAPCPHCCQRALEYALITPPESRDPSIMQRLDAVAGRVLRHAQ